VSSHAKPTEVKFQVPVGPCSQLSTSSQAPWVCHVQPLPDIFSTVC